LPAAAHPASLPPMPRRTVRLLTGLLALGGCRMLDQRTFAPASFPPDAAAMARPVLPAAPALRLHPSDPTSDWRAALDAEVREALAHNPNTAFELLTPIPLAEKQPVQDRFARDGAADAQTVAAALRQDGVAAGRITLGYQGDAGKPVREVRLFVQ
jgi:hypothetical protein